EDRSKTIMISGGLASSFTVVRPQLASVALLPPPSLGGPASGTLKKPACPPGAPPPLPLVPPPLPPPPFPALPPALPPPPPLPPGPGETFVSVVQAISNATARPRVRSVMCKISSRGAGRKRPQVYCVSEATV